MTKSRYSISILRVLFGMSYRDASASDLYKKEVLDKIQMDSRGRLLQAEIATKAKFLGYRAVEVEVEHYPRQAGKQTGIRPRTAFLSLVDFWRVMPGIWKLKKSGQAQVASQTIHSFDPDSSPRH